MLINSHKRKQAEISRRVKSEEIAQAWHVKQFFSNSVNNIQFNSFVN